MRIRCDVITKALKAYDRLLYAEPVVVNRRRPDYNELVHKNPNEVLEQVHIKRKSKRYNVHRIDQESYLLSLVEDGDFLFALTEDFSTKTNPVEWGVLPILQKLKEMDRWARGGEDLFDEMWKHNEKIDESVSRARSHVLEDSLREMHRGFKKATNDVNTAGLKDPRLKQLKTRSY